MTIEELRQRFLDQAEKMRASGVKPIVHETHLLCGVQGGYSSGDVEVISCPKCLENMTVGDA